ncbi:amino acid ABC transporter substrate-binding protein [bacterium]|uniref:ABC transporter substrate-binding protein n=1 Tax=Salipiger bermudensis TaxID=344736 RepID=UPI000C96DEC0|nr:ABC transporter substrate-binding protein [Salipiger bermudensis]MAE92884.1 branched-chain amino acid ABC transporter substrate-binding protein [Pelagibaca sp.]MBR9890780.1 amino acid ABC transporter substrate-binding protein [bacterium]MCA1286945.1 ABC transporter substrate-binding protein [Salipiger bermudensis]
MTRRFTLAGAIVSLACLAMPAVAEEHTIGAIFPLSGTNAVYGDVFMSGADLAVEHINADGVLSGPLSIAYEDSQALPQPAVVAMTKLVNVTGVPYTLSAFTGVSKAISTLATRNSVVGVNGGGVGPDLAELGDYFWNVIPLANLEMRAVVPFLVEERGLKSFALVYVDDPLGDAMHEELETILPEVGGELVDSFSVPTTAQQFSGVAAQVRASGADVVYVASYGNQQLQIVKQLRDNGVDAQLVAYSGYAVPDALALPESEGMIITGQGVDFDSEDAVTKRFVEDYTAKFDRAPTAYNVNYYNAVLVYGALAAAIEAEGGEVTGEALLEARRATESFDLVGGTVSFQDNGTLLFPIQVKEIRDGAAHALTSVTFD